MGRALIVSATDLLVRGVLASPPSVTGPDGSVCNALFAASRALFRALASKKPDTALAFLAVEPEPDWDPLAVEQLESMVELLEAFGFVVERAEDATHQCARAVAGARRAGSDAVVVGYDKRLAQLVADDVWFYDAYKDVRYTPELVRKRFGVPPSQVAEWLALVGDNYATPGVRGIGQKGAVTLLEQYGTVEEALRNLDDIRGRTGNALRAVGAGIHGALAEARLESIEARDLPAYSPSDASVLNGFFERWGLFTLVSAETRRVPHTFCSDPDSARAAVRSLESPAAVHAVFDGPSPVRGQLVALGFTDGERTLVVGSSGLPGVLEWLADPTVEKIGHDLKHIGVCAPLAGWFGDTAIASHQHEPSNRAPHDLGPVVREVLGRALPADDAILGKGARRKRWAGLDRETLGNTLAERVEAVFALWRRLAPGLNAEPYAEALALAAVLIELEQHGMPVDRADLEASGADFDAINAELETEIHRLAGRSFTINSTKQLGTVLYEELGLEVVARTKTGPSTATFALERIAHDHPIVPLVIRWRTLRRLRDTWVTALAKAVDPDGRVRSTFHPARSFTGRMVNSHPDLGRVPGRTPELKRIRHAFVARPGHVLLSIDFEQLGLYVLAHLTGDPALVGPLSANADMHTQTACAVLDLAAVTPAQRQLGKVVNFATFAGQGASALARQLGVPASEAKLYIGRFDERYAVTRAFQEGELKNARERGYVQLISGRHWPIGNLDSRDPQILGYAERLARRATHEGSVADVTRRALVQAHRALRDAGLSAALLVQVLDEIVFEVPESELDDVIEVAGHAMRTAYDLRVPLRTGHTFGPRWSDLKA